ncbi:MAG: hypothetical protein CMJ46_13395 [Planctomyces sp.]|nr:hypothetical protein [Planctomyces sp.]
MQTNTLLNGNDAEGGNLAQGRSQSVGELIHYFTRRYRDPYRIQCDIRGEFVTDDGGEAPGEGKLCGKEAVRFTQDVKVGKVSTSYSS